MSVDARTDDPASGEGAAAGDGAGRGPAGGADGTDGPALDRPGNDRPEIAAIAPSGRVPYREGLELQRRLARARIDGDLERDLLLLVEHDPVLTLGRGTGEGHLRAGRDRLDELGVETVEIERGGDVTYHGPGQLVGYPVLHLASYRKDLHWYLRAVEEALIRALGRLGLPAFRVPEHTGVWVGDENAAAGAGSSAADAADDDGGEEPGAGAADDAAEAAILAGRIRKIASIGVHVSRWVTWHGFALNVTQEPMEHFRLIVPCGIRGVQMTSLEGEGVGAGERRVRAAVAAGFASVFDARVVGGVELSDLPEPAAPAGGPGDTAGGAGGGEPGGTRASDGGDRPAAAAGSPAREGSA